MRDIYFNGKVVKASGKLLIIVPKAMYHLFPYKTEVKIIKVMGK